MEFLVCLPGLVLMALMIGVPLWLGTQIRKRRMLGSTGIRVTDSVGDLDAATQQRLSAVAPGERLIKAVRCAHGGNNFGWLVATDSHIWWFATTMLNRGEETEFPYDAAIDIIKPTEISTDRRLVIGGALFAMSKEDAEAMAVVLRRQRGILQSQNSAEPTGGVSAADELAKFARMRDEGILTAEEFEAKKRKLLED